MKQLMFREYLRSKRLNRIKSKTWRKVHGKSEKFEQGVKLLERLQRENPELAQELLEGLVCRQGLEAIWEAPCRRRRGRVAYWLDIFV